MPEPDAWTRCLQTRSENRYSARFNTPINNFLDKAERRPGGGWPVRIIKGADVLIFYLSIAIPIPMPIPK